MENQTPEVIGPQRSKSNLILWVVIGVAVLAAGVGIGLTAGKYSSPVSSQISSYDDCIKAKGSLVQESYPAICVTTGGQRFTQPIPVNSVSCGGWDTSGEIVCECSGKLVKPSCPLNSVCDGQTYLCEGACGQCCYKGLAENGLYPKCQD